jgi:hypothetical protein
MANYGFKNNKTMLLRKRSLPKLLVVQNTTGYIQLFIYTQHYIPPHL